MSGSKSTIVRVRGEHDIATKESLAIAIAGAAQRDESADVIVDLRGVTFLDASTIGVLVASHNRLRVDARALRLRAPSPWARRLIELCDLGYLIESDITEPATHATGAAAALSTWVEVTPSSSRGTSVPGETQSSKGRERDRLRATADRDGA